MTSKRVSSNEMVVSKNKNKVLCSTPEHRKDSASIDSDSICDSDAASPVPFLCTQDGTEGETDVIWNHYTPKSGSKKRHSKNTTPLSRRSKKPLRPKVLDKPIPKRKPLKVSQKRSELLQELFELNKNLPEIISNKVVENAITERDNFEDDIFNESLEFSPKCSIKNNTCLRKNVLSSKFSKHEHDNGFDSDDSINECLLKASQMLEENLLKHEVPNTIPTMQTSDILNNKTKCVNSSIVFKMDNDSMDAILNSIKVDSPIAKRLKKCQSPQINNDSFDGFFGNLNDSAIEQLTQVSSKITKKPSESTLDCQSPATKTIFGRHNSMPESPSLTDIHKPSTSGMVFGRYNSMPVHKNDPRDQQDSPIRCTPEEIKKKHQLAREKLLAKRQLPFTATQPSNSVYAVSEATATSNSKPKFQPKIPSDKAFNIHRNNDIKLISGNLPEKSNTRDTNCNDTDIKSVIEKKRQEALQKLRLRKAISQT